ncbi:MAG: 2-succinyl-6-hydroxy-2,4-cyclohexadiene-1-carboxylate synthase [Deltaproteobacteria bacterium]|nr:2-succinyl-6-hydroxy-2,4-cyclohexadiene-1-carboxylate synthase [Deltaproteobacteria bacterium]
MTRIAVNDIHLNVEVKHAGPALLLLHGFTGSCTTWVPHREAWREFTLIVVDLLGHGRSDCPADPDRYRMERCVADLLALLDRLGVQQTAVLGYSLGGRVALHLALHAPERLWALVLESASPGSTDAAERESRRHSDAVLAEAIERDGIVAFVNRWQALPLFATQAQLPGAVREELRRQRLDNNPQGLANSLRGLGAGMPEPVLQRLGQMQVPTLLLAGALDDKYCELARRMATVLPHQQLALVPESGHAVHLEQPVVFADTVQRFLDLCLQNKIGKKEKLRCA